MLFTRLITDESIKVLDGNAVDDILLKARISVLTTFSQKNIAARCGFWLHMSTK